MGDQVTHQSHIDRTRRPPAPTGDVGPDLTVSRMASGAAIAGAARSNWSIIQSAL